MATVDAVDDVIAKIKAGAASPFFLVYGEEFLARRAAEAICDALVPAAARDLNFSQLDGAVGGREVAQHLDTVPMFRGTKLVFVDGADVLLAERDVAKELVRAKELWLQPARKKAAALRVLSIVAPAGWTWRELDPEGTVAPSKAKWKKDVGLEPEAEDLRFFGEVAKYCEAQDLKAPKNDLEALLKSLQQGPPRGNHLLLLCEKYDAKHPVAKLVAERGTVVHRAPERDFKKRGIEGLDINEQCREVLEPLGKRLSPAAVTLLKDRVGDAMRQLASELEKLALYVGDRKIIDERDVELLVAPLREEEFYELGNALSDGDAGRTLKLLEEELARGKHPLPLMGVMAASVRRMAVDAARYSKIPGALGGRELSYRDFQASLFPRFSELCAGEKVPHPFVAWNNYRRVRKHGVRKSLRALALCAEVDQRLKRGGGALELERLAFALALPS